jgi:hypothetical protein
MFGEDGGLAYGKSVDEHRQWRWRPYDEINSILTRQKAPLLIAKPLVESQHATKLLEQFPDAKIIWAYRNYRDVASSSLVKFGPDTTLYNLSAVLDPNRSSHWYSENLSDATRSIVARYFDRNRPIYDLKALGWYVRNSLFFQLGLDSNLRVTLCKYEDLAANPNKVMSRLYAFLDAPYPGPRIVSHIHCDSVSKGRDVQVHEDIRALCDQMLRNLDDAYDRDCRVRAILTTVSGQQRQ